MKKDTLSASYALDTSVLIEMLTSSPLGNRLMNSLIAYSTRAYTSEVNLAEAEYVLCRRLGYEAAKAKMDKLRKSNFLLIADTEQTSRIAARIKCQRSLSLADCYSIATSKATESKALFAFREQELTREIGRKPEDIEVSFLEDLIKEEEEEAEKEEE